MRIRIGIPLIVIGVVAAAAVVIGQGAANEDPLRWNQTGAGPARAPGPASLPGAGNAIWALVDRRGHLMAGPHAKAAERLGRGRYLVTFDTDVSHCAASATVGFNQDHGQPLIAPASAPQVFLGLDGPDQAEIRWWRVLASQPGTYANTDTSFFVTVTC